MVHLPSGCASSLVQAPIGSAALLCAHPHPTPCSAALLAAPTQALLCAAWLVGGLEESRLQIAAEMTRGFFPSLIPGCAMSGLIADAKTLIDKARVETQVRLDSPQNSGAGAGGVLGVGWWL